MLPNKQKKSRGSKSGNRLLISVTILRSAGLLRFVVNEDELVATVIVTALKSYACEGRLPVLGYDHNNFMLYCPNYVTQALSPWETIGSIGVRNYMLCKKPQAERAMNNVKSPVMAARKPSGSWKSWLNGSLRLKISSH